MDVKQRFIAPQLTEYGRLLDIVQMPHEGVPHNNNFPTGWEGRTPECSGGAGPGKPAPKADAWWECGSS